MKTNPKQALTTAEFVARATTKHGNTYDYSDTHYIGKFKKLQITCRVHGPFSQEAWGHMKGRGCSSCAMVKPLTTADFIQRSEAIHGQYGYLKTIYTTQRNRLIVTCRVHGDFVISASNHLARRGCPKCAGRNRTEAEFIQDAQRIHGLSYDYGTLNYSIDRRHVTIVCASHGAFQMLKGNHLIGQGCPICSASKGEAAIAAFLESNNVIFTPEKRFNDCRDRAPLPFDFYLPTLNICIEFDGRQHSEAVAFFGGAKALAGIQRRDNIKTAYCKQQGIALLRLTESTNIPEFLHHSLFNEDSRQREIQLSDRDTKSS